MPKSGEVPPILFHELHVQARERDRDRKLELLDHKTTTPHERAEDRRLHIAWKRIQRAHAALAVEKCVRMHSVQELTIGDVLARVPFPPSVVNKSFLLLCERALERYSAQKKALERVIYAFQKSVQSLGLPVTDHTLGVRLFESWSKRFPACAKEKISLQQKYGFLYFCIDDDREYDFLVGEETATEKSGGRFYSGVEFSACQSAVPCILVRGAPTKNIENDPVMTHEIQHWINQGLVGIAGAEPLPPGILIIEQDQKTFALREAERAVSIKDELLAYIRQGKFVGMKEVLFSSIYAHLFDSSPKDGELKDDRDREVKVNRMYVEHVSAALEKCVTIFGHEQNLPEMLTYALFDVPLRSFAAHIDNIREFYEKLLRDKKTNADMVFLDLQPVMMVPTAYTNVLQAFRNAQNILLNDEDVLFPKCAKKDSSAPHKTFASRRRVLKRALIEAKSMNAALRPDEFFVPHVVMIEGCEKYAESERAQEHRRIQAVLDDLSHIPMTSWRALSYAAMEHPERTSNEERSIVEEITRRVQSLLPKQNRDGALVRCVASPNHVQVQCMYMTNVRAMFEPVMFAVNIETTIRDRSSGPRSFDETCSGKEHGELFYDHDLTVFPYVAARQYEPIYDALREVEYEESSARHCMRSLLPVLRAEKEKRMAFFQGARECRVAQQEKKHILQKLFHNGAHIPEVFFPNIPSMPSDLGWRSHDALRKFGLDLFTLMQGVPQHTIDQWFRDRRENVEENWEPHAEMRERILHAFPEKQKKQAVTTVRLFDMYFADTYVNIVLDFRVWNESSEAWEAGKIVCRLYQSSVA